MLGRLTSIAKPLFGQLVSLSAMRLHTPGVEIVDLDVRPDKKVKRGKSRLKQKYLTKFPPIKQDAEGNYMVEGVSNKAMPCPIPWKMPGKVFRADRSEDGSGDMSGLLDLVGGSIDVNVPRTEIAESEILDDAPSEVKKIVSLEFARNRDITEYVRTQLLNRTKDHKYDTDSLCAVISSLTVGIRNDQEQLTDNGTRRIMRRDKDRRRSLRRRIERRTFLLSQLRQRDYKKFEWLLEELDIVYKPAPMELEDIQRRVHQSRLTALWCDEHRLHKLREYKRSLELQQPTFLREKAEKLRWVMNEETELGLETTVNEEEIQRLLKQAGDIETKLTDEKIEEVEYFIYEPRDPKEKKSYFNR